MGDYRYMLAPEACQLGAGVIVVFSPAAPGMAGQLAAVALHFTEGPLKGFKLEGFAVWETQTGGVRAVTFPARVTHYDGLRSTAALLKPVDKGDQQIAHLSFAILTAYDAVLKTPPPTTGTDPNIIEDDSIVISAPDDDEEED